MFGLSPSQQLFRCLPKRLRASKHGRRQHSSGVSPHPQGAWLALRLVCQGDGLHYPVGQPLFGDSLPFLLTSVAGKELLRVSEAPGAVHIYAQCSYGDTSNAKAGFCLLRGQLLAGSPPDRRKDVVGPWAHIQAGVSRQRESRPSRTQGTIHLPKTLGGPQPF